MGVIKNIKTLLADRNVAADYWSYFATRLLHGKAIRHYPEGFSLTGYTSFTEFFGSRQPLNQGERRFMLSAELGHGIIMDVGANLGYVTALLAKRFPDRTIHAFEASPSTFHSLSEGLSLNRLNNVRANNLAVADFKGEILFNASPLDRFKAGIATPESRYATRVECVSLDDYCNEAGVERVALLKVDVEGFEATVFRGADVLLSAKRIGLIFFEVTSPQMQASGIASEAAVNILLAKGYSLYSIRPDGSLAPSDHPAIPREGYTNLVASPS